MRRSTVLLTALLTALTGGATLAPAHATEGPDDRAAWRRIPVPELVAAARFSRDALTIRVTPTPGWHLADDFPARLTIRTTPESGLDEEHDLAGRVAALGSGVELPLPPARPLVVDVELELGICDAAGTCTPTEVSLQVLLNKRRAEGWSETPLWRVRQIRARADVVETLKEPATGRFAARLSLDGGLRSALNEAESRADPLLAVFKTSWCPPCRQLQAEVLEQDAHAEVLDRFVVALFDADLPTSWEAKSRWAVGGYPTLVVATYDGELVWRQEGYDGADALLAELRAVLDGLDEPLLAADEETADPSTALAMATLARHRKDREAAARWLARVPVEAEVDGAERTRVRAFLAVHDPDEAGGAAALEALLLDQALMPAVPLLEQLGWWYELVRLRRRAGDEAGTRTAWERTAAIADRLLASGPERADAAEACSYAATAAEQLGDEVLARASWSAAADHLRGLIAPGGSIDAEVIARAPGRALELVHALAAAGRDAEARALLDVAVDLFPDQPAFHQARARAEHRLGAPADVYLAAASTAHELARGDDRLRSADLWSELLVEAGRTDEAIAVLRGALDGLQLPADPTIRTHRYARGLQQRLDELGGAPPPEPSPEPSPEPAAPEPSPEPAAPGPPADDPDTPQEAP